MANFLRAIITGATLLFVLGAPCLVRAVGNQDALISLPLEQALIRELSGISAKEYITQITAYDRTTVAGYQAAMKLIDTHLREMGIKDVRIESYRGLPEEMHFAPKRLDWWPPLGWQVHKAQLWLEPGEKLADYQIQPITLARYSRSANLTAEAVFVGPGTNAEDYANVNVKDKVVVATGDAGTVCDQAVVKREALGVVIARVAFENSETDRGLGYPAMIGWQVLNPETKDIKRPNFAFSLSSETGNRLIGLIQAGKKPRLRVDIDADVFQTSQDVLTALLPGSDPSREVLFVAHLDHPRPSANDNGSGSGLLVELARCLLTLANEGVFKPRYSIRFLWVTEGEGTLGYIQSHPDISQRVIAAINLDMVGEEVFKTHSILRINRTPDSLPSFLNDVVLNMVRRVDALDLRSPLGTREFFNFRVMPASADSDHNMLNDGGVHVPAVMLSHNPDDFHHTNLDTPDKVDPTELKRVGFISAATAIFISTAGEKESQALAATIYNQAQARLAEVQRQAAALLLVASPPELENVLRLCETKLHFVVARELATLDSARALGTNGGSERFYVELAQQLGASESSGRSMLAALYLARAGQPASTVAPTTLEKQMEAIVPQTAIPFLHNLWEEAMDKSRLTTEEQQWLGDFTKRLDLSEMRIPELLNFVDGRRNLWDIAQSTATEALDWDYSFRPIGAVDEFSTEYGPIDPNDVLRLFTDFRKAGLIKW